MKRSTSKKTHPRGKGAPRRAKNPEDNRPMEFDRAWQDLEVQHDRIKSDFMSLAAQLGINSRLREPGG